VTESPAPVVYRRRPGRQPLTCSVCGGPIMVGHTYEIAYQAVERDGKVTVVTEPRHVGCRSEGVKA
jgi:hypothetical protein